MKTRQLYGLPALLIIAVVAAGCGGHGQQGAKTSPSEDRASDVTSAATQQMDPKTPVSDDVKALVQGNNEFAFDLFAQLAKKEQGNIIFSPYSISTALAMTYAGAQEKTAAEMAKVLHFTMDQEKLHTAFKDLADDLQKDEKARPYQLNIANALWARQGTKFVPQFLERTQNNHGAGLKEVNFGQPEAARKIINRWVEQQTKEKIKDLLLPGDVNPLTQLVLTNAIYFKGTWKTSFPKSETKDAIFEVAPDRKPLVPLMHHKSGAFKYIEANGFHWLELPYHGKRLSMVLLLPQKKGELPTLEKALTASVIQDGLANLHVANGEVSLPRFKFTFRSYLLQNLAEMGMPAGPFSGIIASEDLSISNVIHKAFIDLDENGTEAAAATAVIFTRTDARPFIFRADHPFLFFIRDVQTGSNLFMGRVTDPSQISAGW